MTINQTDLDVRIQLTGCCIADKGALLVKNLQYGGNCISEKFIELRLLINYLDILESYNLESENNCLTETQIKNVSNSISEICNICFKPFGYTYTI